jgi:hypothetical protein
MSIFWGSVPVNITTQKGRRLYSRKRNGVRWRREGYKNMNNALASPLPSFFLFQISPVTNIIPKGQTAPECVSTRTLFIRQALNQIQGTAFTADKCLNFNTLPYMFRHDTAIVRDIYIQSNSGCRYVQHVVFKFTCWKVWSYRWYNCG